jgi:hypothetical protein
MAEAPLAQLKLRVPEGLRKQIQDAADARGVSVNAEVIFRLQASLERDATVGGLLDDPTATALGEVVAAAMMEAGRFAGYLATNSPQGGQRWADNPYAYEQAVQAAHHVLDALRPEGKVVPPAGGRGYSGKASAEAIIHEMGDAPLEVFSYGYRLRARLGYLAGRLKKKSASK